MKGRVAPGFARDGKTEKTVKIYSQVSLARLVPLTEQISEMIVLDSVLRLESRRKGAKTFVPHEFLSCHQAKDICLQFNNSHFKKTYFYFLQGLRIELERIQYAFFFFSDRKICTRKLFSTVRTWKKKAGGTRWIASTAQMLTVRGHRHGQNLWALLFDTLPGVISVRITTEPKHSHQFDSPAEQRQKSLKLAALWEESFIQNLNSSSASTLLGPNSELLRWKKGQEQGQRCSLLTGNVVCERANKTGKKQSKACIAVLLLTYITLGSRVTWDS